MRVWVGSWPLVTQGESSEQCGRDTYNKNAFDPEFCRTCSSARQTAGAVLLDKVSAGAHLDVRVWDVAIVRVHSVQ